MHIQDYLNTSKILREIFDEIPADYLEKIQVKEYKAKEYIIKSGTHEKNLILILNGICGVWYIDDMGRKFEVYKIKSMDCIGFGELFIRIKPREADVVAHTDTVAALIPQSVMEACFGKYQKFSVYLTKRIIYPLHRAVTLSSQYTNSPAVFGVVTIF